MQKLRSQSSDRDPTKTPVKGFYTTSLGRMAQGDEVDANLIDTFPIDTVSENEYDDKKDCGACNFDQSLTYLSLAKMSDCSLYSLCSSVLKSKMMSVSDGLNMSLTES